MTQTGPRKNHSTWDEEFFGMAYLAATRSKDPNTQCGACIGKDHMVIGSGYNGLATGLEDTEEYWNPEVKENYVLHAEENAIVNADSSRLQNSTMYLWNSRHPLFFAGFVFEGLV